MSAITNRHVFVKVSGDLTRRPEVRVFIEKLLRRNSVTICVGGGTQINLALKKARFEVGKHGPLGREPTSDKASRIAIKTLAEEQWFLQREIVPQRHAHTVILPVIDLGGVPCHVNGDKMVEVAYLCYKRLYVLTTKDRVEKKQREMEWLAKKVIVVGF